MSKHFTHGSKKKIGEQEARFSGKTRPEGTARGVQGPQPGKTGGPQGSDSAPIKARTCELD